MSAINVNSAAIVMAMYMTKMNKTIFNGAEIVPYTQTFLVPTLY